MTPCSVTIRSISIQSRRSSDLPEQIEQAIQKGDCDAIAQLRKNHPVLRCGQNRCTKLFCQAIDQIEASKHKEERLSPPKSWKVLFELLQFEGALPSPQICKKMVDVTLEAKFNPVMQLILERPFYAVHIDRKILLNISLSALEQNDLTVFDTVRHILARQSLSPVEMEILMRKRQILMLRRACQRVGYIARYCLLFCVAHMLFKRIKEFYP